MLKIGLGSLILLPIRLLISLICLTLATSVGLLSLCGLTEEEIENTPFSGWRLNCRKVVSRILRFTYFCCGFHWIKTSGCQAKPEEAPILVVGSHSSFFDAIAVIVMGGPSVVAKEETSHIPFWGSLIRCTQPVLVKRTDPNSRQTTINMIKERTGPGSGWQQVFIFPEGTCTNRTSLILFRLGAFIPGVPVQPICLRYSNSLDTVTWTWEGIGALKVLCWTLAQLHTSVQLEYLPPYVPNKQEKEDPKLFASNVRAVMAKQLNIPVTDCNYFDYLRIEKSLECLKRLQKLQRRMESNITDKTRYLEDVEDDSDCFATRKALAERLGVVDTLPELAKVCDSFGVSGEGGEEAVIDVRQLRVASLVASKEDGLRAFMDSLKLFDKDLGDNAVSKKTLDDILRHHFFLSPKEAGVFIGDLGMEGSIDIDKLEEFLLTTKPNYVKVIRAGEGELTNHDIALLLANKATRTAELMAAGGSNLLMAGKDVVSEVSAKMAASREKMTDAFSSSIAAGATALSSFSPINSNSGDNRSAHEDKKSK